MVAAAAVVGRGGGSRWWVAVGRGGSHCIFCVFLVFNWVGRGPAAAGGGGAPAGSVSAAAEKQRTRSTPCTPCAAHSAPQPAASSTRCFLVQKGSFASLLPLGCCSRRSSSSSSAAGGGDAAAACEESAPCPFFLGPQRADRSRGARQLHSILRAARSLSALHAAAAPPTTRRRSGEQHTHTRARALPLPSLP